MACPSHGAPATLVCARLVSPPWCHSLPRFLCVHGERREPALTSPPTSSPCQALIAPEGRTRRRGARRAGPGPAHHPLPPPPPPPSHVIVVIAARAQRPPAASTAARIPRRLPSRCVAARRSLGRTCPLPLLSIARCPPHGLTPARLPQRGPSACARVKKPSQSRPAGLRRCPPLPVPSRLLLPHTALALHMRPCLSSSCARVPPPPLFFAAVVAPNRPPRVYVW